MSEEIKALYWEDFMSIAIPECRTRLLYGYLATTGTTHMSSMKMSAELFWLYIWVLKHNLKITYVYRKNGAIKIYLGDEEGHYAVLQ